MAKKKVNVLGSLVELADKDGGFFDPATGFKVVRGQQAELGATVGKKTNLALLSGHLLRVGEAAATPEETAAPDETEDQ